jgi:hypothetical protein
MFLDLSLLIDFLLRAVCVLRGEEAGLNASVSLCSAFRTYFGSSFNEAELMQ